MTASGPSLERQAPRFELAPGVPVGAEALPVLAGPCVIESEDFVWRMARQIQALCQAGRHQFIFKASYDKANRTSARSARGPGV